MTNFNGLTWPVDATETHGNYWFWVGLAMGFANGGTAWIFKVVRSAIGRWTRDGYQFGIIAFFLACGSAKADWMIEIFNNRSTPLTMYRGYADTTGTVIEPQHFFEWHFDGSAIVGNSAWVATAPSGAADETGYSHIAGPQLGYDGGVYATDPDSGQSWGFTVGDPLAGGNLADNGFYHYDGDSFDYSPFVVVPLPPPPVPNPAEGEMVSLLWIQTMVISVLSLILMVVGYFVSIRIVNYYRFGGTIRRMVVWLAVLQSYYVVTCTAREMTFINQTSVECSVWQTVADDYSGYTLLSYRVPAGWSYVFDLGDETGYVYPTYEHQDFIGIEYSTSAFYDSFTRRKPSSGDFTAVFYGTGQFNYGLAVGTGEDMTQVNNTANVVLTNVAEVRKRLVVTSVHTDADGNDISVTELDAAVEIGGSATKNMAYSVPFTYNAVLYADGGEYGWVPLSTNTGSSVQVSSGRDFHDTTNPRQLLTSDVFSALPATNGDGSLIAEATPSQVFAHMARGFNGLAEQIEKSGSSAPESNSFPGVPALLGRAETNANAESALYSNSIACMATNGHVPSGNANGLSWDISYSLGPGHVVTFHLNPFDYEWFAKLAQICWEIAYWGVSVALVTSLVREFMATMQRANVVPQTQSTLGTLAGFSTANIAICIAYAIATTAAIIIIPQVILVAIEAWFPALDHMFTQPSDLGLQWSVWAARQFLPLEHIAYCAVLGITVRLSMQKQFAIFATVRRWLIS